jgi:hypothetical protein
MVGILRSSLNAYATSKRCPQTLVDTFTLYLAFYWTNLPRSCSIELVTSITVCPVYIRRFHWESDISLQSHRRSHRRSVWRYAHWTRVSSLLLGGFRLFSLLSSPDTIASNPIVNMVLGSTIVVLPFSRQSTYRCLHRVRRYALVNT